MKFIETSAKEADNVEALFHDIARELIRQVQANEIEPQLVTDSTEINAGGSTQIYTTVSECCSRFS
jgi:Ras-related protein Rab-30